MALLVFQVALLGVSSMSLVAVRTMEAAVSVERLSASLSAVADSLAAAKYVGDGEWRAGSGSVRWRAVVGGGAGGGGTGGSGGTGRSAANDDVITVRLEAADSSRRVILSTDVVVLRAE